MSNPFQTLIQSIADVGYHNHRTEEHSDIVSQLIWGDLIALCPALKADFAAGVVRKWLNVRAPGGRHRRIDLFVGEPGADGGPDLTRIRIGIENKSVITAHRNRTNRYDDVSEVVGSVLAVKPEAILAAVVVVGFAQRVLNIPDRVKPLARNFEKKVRPRLSSGDQTLWTQFPAAISDNSADDAKKTVAKFRSLPTRSLAHTHAKGLDWLLIVPVHVDNVDPPRLLSGQECGIDVEQDYDHMIQHICRAYTARWHS